VHAVTEAVMGRGNIQLKVDPLIMLMTMAAAVTNALTMRRDGFDDARVKLESLLAEMVRCIFNSGRPEAFEQFFCLVGSCNSDYHMNFLSSMFTPPPGLLFLDAFELALRSFCTYPRVAGCVRRFDFSRWMVSNPIPDPSALNRAQEILIRMFCCTPDVKNYLTDFIRTSLAHILGKSDFSQLLFFLQTAFRYSLPANPTVCTVCCLSSAIWSATKAFPWDSLDCEPRAIVLQTLADSFDEAKRSGQSFIMSRVTDLVAPLGDILASLGPKRSIPREGALMVSEKAMKLFSLLYADLNDIPWSVEDKQAELNARHVLKSIFSVIGCCARCACDPETSFFVMQNIWQLLTDDQNGVVGKHSLEVESPPPHIQHVVLEGMGFALPWHLWCLRSEDLARIRDNLMVGGSRPLIRNMVNDTLLIITTSVCRSDAPAATDMALNRSCEDVLILSWCVAQSFQFCQNLTLCKQLEASFADSVANLGLPRLSMEQLGSLTTMVSEVFQSRAANNTPGPKSPISFLLCMIASASGIIYRNTTSIACNLVAITPNCNIERVNFCLSVFNNILKCLPPEPEPLEQAAGQTAIKAFFSAMTRIAAREQAAAASQDLPPATLRTIANNAFEQMAVPLITGALGLSVPGRIGQATEAAVNQCLVEDVKMEGGTNFLRALTRASFDPQVPMDRLVRLSSVAVDKHFEVSDDWGAVATALAVTPERFSDFMTECAVKEAIPLLQLAWLTNKNAFGELPCGLWLAWLDTMNSSVGECNDVYYVLLIVGALSGAMPPDCASFESTQPYAEHLTQLMGRLDNMHNDKANRLARFLHLTSSKPYTVALQLFASAISQLIQACFYTDDVKRTFVRVQTSNPRPAKNQVQSHTRAFVKHTTSSAVTKQYDKQVMATLGANVSKFMEDPSLTYHSWPNLVNMLVRTIWPNSKILARLCG